MPAKGSPFVPSGSSHFDLVRSDVLPPLNRAGQVGWRVGAKCKMYFVHVLFDGGELHPTMGYMLSHM